MRNRLKSKAKQSSKARNTTKKLLNHTKGREQPQGGRGGIFIRVYSTWLNEGFLFTLQQSKWKQQCTQAQVQSICTLVKVQLTYRAICASAAANTNTEQHKPTPYQYNVTIVLFLENLGHFIVPGNPKQQQHLEKKTLIHHTPPSADTQTHPRSRLESTPWERGSREPQNHPAWQIPGTVGTQTLAMNGTSQTGRVPHKKSPVRREKIPSQRSWVVFTLSLKSSWKAKLPHTRSEAFHTRTLLAGRQTQSHTHTQSHTLQLTPWLQPLLKTFQPGRCSDTASGCRSSTSNGARRENRQRRWPRRSEAASGTCETTGGGQRDAEGWELFPHRARKSSAQKPTEKRWTTKFDNSST